MQKSGTFFQQLDDQLTFVCEKLPDSSVAVNVAVIVKGGAL